MYTLAGAAVASSWDVPATTANSVAGVYASATCAGEVEACTDTDTDKTCICYTPVLKMAHFRK